jgi:hypothetical protein
MRRKTVRLAVGVLLILIALMPPGSVIGRPSQLPPACQELAFSTEEEFLTQGLETPDGNPVISDGDLLSSTANGCVICARNIELLSSFDLQDVDLGLDAVDVIDAERVLVSFSTELDSPYVGQFTAGDLLATNGMVIANVALTDPFGVGHDIGLDAVHFVGDPAGIVAFLDEARQYSRADWLSDPGRLARMLVQYEIDIWFSTEGTFGPMENPDILDGDLLSARGIKIAGNDSLLPGTVPAGIPVRGVDFGLDAITDARIPEGQLMYFSTELLFEGDPSFTDGDILQAGNGVVARNADLIGCFEPKARELGLDALHKAFQAMDVNAYLPLILRNFE